MKVIKILFLFLAMYLTAFVACGNVLGLTVSPKAYLLIGIAFAAFAAMEEKGN